MKENNAKSFLVWTAIAVLATFSLNACAKKQTVKATPSDEMSDQANLDDSMKTDELDIHGKDFMESPNLAAIYFEYDSSSLSDEARKSLEQNADYLKSNPDQEILTEGHCDDRGTIGYNLALGQKRSAAVRQYYIYLGVKPKRIGSLSYGKEKPVCSEATEECWSKNRRVETKVRTIRVSTTGTVNDQSSPQ